MSRRRTKQNSQGMGLCEIEMNDICPSCGIQVQTERLSDGIILVPFHRSPNGEPYCGGRWLG